MPETNNTVAATATAVPTSRLFNSTPWHSAGARGSARTHRLSLLSASRPIGCRARMRRYFGLIASVSRVMPAEVAHPGPAVSLRPLVVDQRITGQAEDPFCDLGALDLRRPARDRQRALHQHHWPGDRPAAIKVRRFRSVEVREDLPGVVGDLGQ